MKAFSNGDPVEVRLPRSSEWHPAIYSESEPSGHRVILSCGRAVVVTKRRIRTDTASSIPRGEEQVWYRYEDTAYAAPVGEFGEPHGIGRIEVSLHRYAVVRTTSKGVWVSFLNSDGHRPVDDRRFVLSAARKRFACPTEAEARESFIARKRRQIRIYRARIDRAERALIALERVTP